MTTPQEPPLTPPGPHEAGFFTTIRSWNIVRGEHGVLGGVVEGIGEKIGMARVPGRIIVALLAIFATGPIFLAYAAGWALLPDKQGRIIIQNFGRGVPNVGALIGIAIMSIIGLSTLFDGPNISFPGLNGEYGSGALAVLAAFVAFVTSLAIIGGIVWLIVVLVRRSKNAEPVGAHASQTAYAQADAAKTTAMAQAADATEQAYAAVPAPSAQSVQAPMPPAPSYAAAPPVAPKPRIPGPGRAFYLTALAWFFASAAIIAWLERSNQLAINPVIAWGVLGATGLGVILMLIALAGRKLGFLGFLGGLALVPTAIILANASELRSGDLSDALGIDPEQIAEVISQDVDPTVSFGADYATVVVAGYCRTPYEGEPYTSTTSTTRVTLDDLTQSTTIDVTTETMYLTIPAGTAFELIGEANAQATVFWQDRNILCDFGGSDKPYVQLFHGTEALLAPTVQDSVEPSTSAEPSPSAGPEPEPTATTTGEPVLTLRVLDDEFANTIVITEEN